jgi:hypothetical protein
MISFLIYLKNNFYRPQDQMGFKDPATALMEQIVELHHFIFFFILLISGLVMWLLIQIIDSFIYLYHFNTKNETNKFANLNKFLIYTYGVLSSKTRFFKEDKYLKACWTLLPAFIGIILSLLYLLIQMPCFNAFEGEEIFYNLGKEFLNDLKTPGSAPKIKSKLYLDLSVLIGDLGYVFSFPESGSGYLFKNNADTSGLVSNGLASEVENSILDNHSKLFEKYKKTNQNEIYNQLERDSILEIEPFSIVNIILNKLNNLFSYFGLDYFFSTPEKRNIDLKNDIVMNHFFNDLFIAKEKNKLVLTYLTENNFFVNSTENTNLLVQKILHPFAMNRDVVFYFFKNYDLIYNIYELEKFYQNVLLAADPLNTMPSEAELILETRNTLVREVFPLIENIPDSMKLETVSNFIEEESKGILEGCLIANIFDDAEYSIVLENLELLKKEGLITPCRNLYLAAVSIRL